MPQYVHGDIVAARRRATSKTRHTLLDAVAKMLLDEGYASVTYRALARRSGDTEPGAVLPVSTIRRYSERNLAYLNKTLEKRTADPLRALWEYSWDEATGTLMIEFMALANHRKTIRTEIAAVTKGVRKIQTDALTTQSAKSHALGATYRFPPCSCSSRACRSS